MQSIAPSTTNELIVFMGSMNAMPMMYAWELKKRGFNVLYFVEVSKKDILCRPENHFPDIKYPYPDWIHEFVLPTQIILTLFPKMMATLYLHKIKQLTGKTISHFFLNGFFTSLAPYLTKDAMIISLSHGSDLDSWAYKGNEKTLAKSIGNRSIFKFTPACLTSALIKYIINTQFLGYLKSSIVVYFPKGFNSIGDEVLEQLTSSGVRYIPRYDISFEPLKGVTRQFKEPGEKLIMFSGVRFLYKTFPDGNIGYSKGNDEIIKGIAKYYRINKNIEVHFVEKGEDVISAKALCHELGIDEVITWHKEMPFNELIDLFVRSDVCFDQLGQHWIAAIGGYALYLGKPLIANDEIPVSLGIWPADNPVLSAKTADDIYRHLLAITDRDTAYKIHTESMSFVEKYMSPQKLLEDIFQC